MSNEIQRFTLYVYREAADMEPDESGEWVRYGDVADLLSRAPSPDVEGWISVEDRLPEDHQTVLVGWTTGGHRLTMFRVKGWWWDSWSVEPAQFNDAGAPTHWRALPDPPKGDE